MLVYFDESYDSDKDFLLLGGLFNPKPQELHREVLKAKQALSYVDRSGRPLEIKYTLSHNLRRYRVARACVDCFAASPSWFRVIVVPCQTF
jgi:hypothetical protein